MWCTTCWYRTAEHLLTWSQQQPKFLITVRSRAVTTAFAIHGLWSQSLQLPLWTLWRVEFSQPHYWGSLHFCHYKSGTCQFFFLGQVIMVLCSLPPPLLRGWDCTSHCLCHPWSLPPSTALQVRQAARVTWPYGLWSRSNFHYSYTLFCWAAQTSL